MHIIKQGKEIPVKKIILLPMVLACAVSLAGCSGQNGGQASDTVLSDSDSVATDSSGSVSENDAAVSGGTASGADEAGSNTEETASGSAGENTPAAADASEYITEDEAKAAALSHAELSESEVTFIKVRLDREDGQQVYDVEFYSGNAEYDYEINASTGEIVSFDYDVEDYTASGGDSQISEDEARAAALSHAGLSESEVTSVRVEQDYDDGRLIYEVEFYTADKEYEYEVNAADGSILQYDVESSHH